MEERSVGSPEKISWNPLSKIILFDAYKMANSGVRIFGFPQSTQFLPHFIVAPLEIVFRAKPRIQLNNLIFTLWLLRDCTVQFCLHLLLPSYYEINNLFFKLKTFSN